MKGKFLLGITLGSTLLLPVHHASAQSSQDHYLAGTEGIKAGSLPGPGLYFDDLNWYGNQGTSTPSGNDNLSLYVNEARLRWMTPWKILGAHYGAEIMLPWGYADEKGKVLWPTSRTPPIQYQPRPYSHSQFYINDLEISPLLLAWQLKQFDISAGYAFWVPTQDNSFAASNGILLAPPQFHFWEHMLTLGATWYPDADRKWAVSVLNHYEINESIHLNTDSIEQPALTFGQLFTTEWGVSRAMGKYFDLGLVGNYQRQTTATHQDAPINPSTYAGSSVEIGPEIKVTIPQWDLSASLRYLRELDNPFTGAESDNLNVVALTLSKRF